MTTKIKLYNNALLELGQSRLSSLAEDREERYIIDEVFDDVVTLCLELGQWNAAIRSVGIAKSQSVIPQFGFDCAFEKPNDWIRTVALSDHPEMSGPLTVYRDEGGYIFANSDMIYMSYVSSDPSYGYNFAEWPETFARYVELSLASRICRRLTANESLKESIERDLRKAKLDAASVDAMNNPSSRPPVGSWVASRGGSGYRNPHRF